MLRTALRPRWLVLLAVVLIAATGMAALGQWQLDRARERGADAVRERQSAPPADLTTLLGPRATFPGDLVDRPVVVTGTLDPAHRLLVTDRAGAGGEPGSRVLEPLVLDDGSAVPVVLGRIATTDPAAADALLADADAGGGTGTGPGRGPVTVRGILRPAEPAPDRAPGAAGRLPAGTLDAVDVTALVQRWPYPLYTGFVIAADPMPGLERVDTVADTSTGFALQNLSYALQWWLFAAFGLFLWWRLVRDDARGLPDRPAAPSSGPVGDDDPVHDEAVKAPGS